MFWIGTFNLGLGSNWIVDRHNEILGSLEVYALVAGPVMVYQQTSLSCIVGPTAPECLVFALLYPKGERTGITAIRYTMPEKKKKN